MGRLLKGFQPARMIDCVQRITAQDVAGKESGWEKGWEKKDLRKRKQKLEALTKDDSIFYNEKAKSRPGRPVL